MATKPLKILQLKPESSEVEILKDNLEIISRRLQESGASLVSIIAVMGTYRTGKSFLLDLLTRFLKQKVALEAAREAAREEAERLARARAQQLSAEAAPGAASEAPIFQGGAVASSQPAADDGWRFGEDDRTKKPPPDWVLEGDSARIHEGSKLDEHSAGFAWRPGKDKCTQGIWLWSSPFVFTDKEGRKVAVLLMDTQGAWDDTMTKAQSATIFGLTALLSSKLIYNIQNRVEEDKLENMDYITTFAQTVCADLPGKDAPFGHLELLVRDWVNYEDGFTLKQCKEQMAEHLDDHLSEEKVPEDAVPRVERLKSTFRSIDAWGLPHPGLKVTKPTYTGEIDFIDRDFTYLLDKFSEEFFGGEGFPRPSAPLGCEITTSGFMQIVMNFAKAFKENAQDMAIGLREAFVKVEMVTARDDLLKRFREQLQKLAPSTAVLDPVELQVGCDKLLQSCEEEFVMKLKPWRMPDADELQAVTEFRQTITEASRARIVSNDQQVEGATLKLLASPVVGSAGYFLLAHHVLLYSVMGLGAYMEANKHSQREGVEMYDPKVLSGIVQDGQNWSIQRWKDLQAIQIALNRLNPQDAMQTLMKASQTAGQLATTAASSASSASGSGQQARDVTFNGVK